MEKKQIPFLQHDREKKVSNEVDYSFGVPTLQTGFDLYCTECGCNDPLQRIKATQTSGCGHRIPLFRARDGIFNLCSRCKSVISDDMQRCYLCSRVNDNFCRQSGENFMKLVRNYIIASSENKYRPMQDPMTIKLIDITIKAKVGLISELKCSSSFELPSNLQTGLSSYCTQCGKSQHLSALEKPSVGNCGHPFILRTEKNWIYSRCVVCDVVISGNCTCGNFFVVGKHLHYVVLSYDFCLEIEFLNYHCIIL